MNHLQTPDAGSSQNHSIQHQPQPQLAPLIITTSGRVCTPDGHSLGTCGSPEAAVDFCQRIGWSYILRHVQTSLDLTGASGEGQP
jgi:hypothetical protein